MPVLICHKENYNAMFFSFALTGYFNCLFFLTISPERLLAPDEPRKNRYRSASLTVEAALVFPIFFFAVFLLWQCFLLVMFQIETGSRITATAMNYAHLGYAERRAEEQDVDISGVYLPLMWTSIPENERVEWKKVDCYPKEDGTICVEVSYLFFCETVVLPKFALPVTQRFSFYPYQGEYSPDLLISQEEKKDVVYVTESGTVYHESRACVYLTVTVRDVLKENLQEERNSFGRSYTECSLCRDMEHTERVYVSSGGTKYHWGLTCSALKRTVMEKKREEVAELPACHKCGGANQ